MLRIAKQISSTPLKQQIRGFHTTNIGSMGALLGKPYAFTARPWELSHIESVDPHDAMGSNVSIHIRGADIMRVQPRSNGEVNMAFCTDKARYAFDALQRQRLIEPMIRNNGVFEAVTWKKALRTVAAKLSETDGKSLAGVAGKMCEAEGMLALKDFMANLNASTSQEGVDSFDPVLSSHHKFNTTFYDLEDADVVLVVGLNIRSECPLMNIRLRRMVLEMNAEVAYIGPAFELTYNSSHLGVTSKTFHNLSEGTHPFLKKLQSAKKPAIICAAGMFSKEDIAGSYSALTKLRKLIPNLVTDSWNGANIMHYHSGRMAGLELGLRADADLSDKEVLYVMGADDIPEETLKDKFIIYQGHHGDRTAQYADIILPAMGWGDKEGTYASTEGRVQLSQKATSSAGLAREDWKIVRAVSEITGKPLPYDDMDQLRQRMADVAPGLLNAIAGNIPKDAFASTAWEGFPEAKVSGKPYINHVNNFFMTDSISRSSVVMAELTGSRPNDSFPHSLNETVPIKS